MHIIEERQSSLVHADEEVNDTSPKRGRLPGSDSRGRPLPKKAKIDTGHDESNNSDIQPTTEVEFGAIDDEDKVDQEDGNEQGIGVAGGDDAYMDYCDHTDNSEVEET